MSIVAGLTGPAGSGKDTVADYLVARHGFVKMALADPIKNLLNERFGWTPEHWADREWKERGDHRYGTAFDGTPMSPRSWAQWLGTEVGRKVAGDDVWARQTRHRMNIPHIQYADQPIVIPDVRFDNEADLLCDKVIRIYRPDDQRPDVREHVSENGLNAKYITATIPNTGTKERLFSLVEVALGLPILALEE